MQVYPDKLAAQLGSLAAVYLIAGDEPLLVNESRDQVRNAAIAQGYDERELIVVDNSFNWGQLLESSNTMSLFAQRRMIELRLQSSKIGTEGSAAICQYLEAPPEDTVLLIVSPRIEGQPKWFKQLKSEAVYVPIYPLDVAKLPGWLRQRARSRGLNLPGDAAQLLADRVEGNLLAAAQEIDKLALLVPAKSTLSVEQIQSAVADSARFSAFNMLDRAQTGAIAPAIRALRHLRETGNEPPAVVAPVAYQLRKLIQVSEIAQQRSLDAALQQLRIHPRQAGPLKQALQHLRPADLYELLELASSADRAAKSGRRSDAWTCLELILLRLAGQHPAHAGHYRSVAETA